jgi:hypothetical protein
MHIIHVIRPYTMLKMLATALVLLLSNVTVSEGSPEWANTYPQIDNCETVTVACPETVDEHSYIKFQASVARAAGPLLPLRYHWTLRGVPKAHIKSGQGTSSIVVSVPRRTAGNLTATVTVTPVTKGCNNQASCRTTIVRRK